MMTKGWKIFIAVLLSVIVILLAVFAILISNFTESGVHVLGKYAHVKFQKKCYLFSADGQVLGDSIMTANGYLRDPAGTETGDFDGFVDVAAYPISVEEGYRSFGGYILRDYISISNKGMDMIDPETEVFYTLKIMRTDPEIIFMFIEREDEEIVLAVCAETEEEARDNLLRYTKLKGG